MSALPGGLQPGPILPGPGDLITDRPRIYGGSMRPVQA